MRSRIEPMKKIARPLAASAPGTRPQFFSTQNLLSIGVVAGLNNKGQSHYERILRLPDVPCPRNWRSTTHLASDLSPNQPTISSDESALRAQRPPN